MYSSTVYISQNLKPYFLSQKEDLLYYTVKQYIFLAQHSYLTSLIIIFLSQPSLLDIQNIHWPHPTLRVQNLLLLSHQLSFISNFISNLINLKGLASFSNSLRQRMNVSEVAEYIIVPDVPEFPDI